MCDRRSSPARWESVGLEGSSDDGLWMTHPSMLLTLIIEALFDVKQAGRRGPEPGGRYDSLIMTVLTNLRAPCMGSPGSLRRDPAVDRARSARIGPSGFAGERAGPGRGRLRLRCVFVVTSPAEVPPGPAAGGRGGPIPPAGSARPGPPRPYVTVR